LGFIGGLFKCGNFGRWNAFPFALGIFPAIRLTGRKVCILAWSVIGSLGDTAAVDTITLLIRADWIDAITARALSTINDLDLCTPSTAGNLAVNREHYATTVAPRGGGQCVGTNEKLVIAAITALVEQVVTLFSH
jgi:hypothetical protein